MARTPKHLTADTPSRESFNDPDVESVVYFPRDDFYVGFVSADTKSRATVVHPLLGRIVVPCADLLEV
jgi:hypothetical protein